jgi:nicotinamide riboside kinase
MEKGVQEQSLRIAILGPECSGKSTLCAAIKEKTDCFVVDEFGREYLGQRKGRVYNHQDLVRIAHVQAKRNKAAVGELIICDTEVTTVAIWAQEKLGGIPPRILELEREQVFDHYVLCIPDMPWEADGLRENEKDRDKLLEAYKERLKMLGRNFTIVSGTEDHRLELIIELIKS